MIKVRDLDAGEIYRFYGRDVVSPLKGYAARKGMLTVALGGLMLGADGKVWGFIDFRPGHRLRAIYRYMMRLLAWAKESGIREVYVIRDHFIDTSEKLLRRGGFEPTGEKISGYEVWVWRNEKVEKNG